jgi:hypothetical protein
MIDRRDAAHIEAGAKAGRGCHPALPVGAALALAASRL